MTDTLEIAQGMFKIYHQVSRLVNECMMDEGVSLARSKFLFLLSCEGPQRSTDIASALGFAPRTVTEAIDGLERDKLVVREPDPRDRRAKIVSITETGLAVMNAAMEPKQKIVKAIFEVLDEEQKSQLAVILECLSSRTQALQRERDDAELEFSDSRTAG